MANRLRGPSSQQILGVLACLLVGVPLLAACGPVSQAPVATTTPSIATQSPSPSPVPSASGQEPASPSASPGQTRTTWGTIWDALPATFPRYPGAEPTDTREGPASATLALPAEPDAASAWWAAALTRLGYRPEATEGPLEDGSLIVHSVGQGPCKVQASFVPLGGSTIETVLLAATCPFR